MASNKRLNAIITIGGAIAGSFKTAIGGATSGLQKIGSEVKSLTDRQKELNRVIASQERLGASGSALRVQYAQQELAVIGKQIAALKQKQAAMARIDALGRANSAKQAELRGKMLGTVAFGAAAASPIVMAAKFETAMLGVAKQVDGAKDSTGKLTPVYYQMAEAIQKLGRELPIPTNEIANMVTAAARMGIAKDDLLEFVKTAAMMGTAFDAPAAELSESMGKIAGIFKIPIKEIASLGDAINYLDDNAISKGSDIIKVMQGDLAGAALTMGISAKNAAALASTFLTLGESAERADTAAAGMLRQLQIAKMNPKKFQVGVQMIGMTADQLQKGMIEDGQGTILKVLDNIKKLPQEKQMEAVTRLFGKDWGGAIAKLAGGVDEYRKQLELANGEANKGSMGREFQSRMATTQAKWETLKNTLVEFAVVTGEVMLPALKSIVDFLQPVIGGLTAMKREHPQLTKVIFGTVLAVAALAIGGLALGYVWTGLVGGALALARAAIFLAPALSVVGSAILWIGRALLMNPIGLTITAIAVAGLLIYKYWEPLKAFVSDFFAGFFGDAKKAEGAMGSFGSAAVLCGEIVGGAFRVMFSPIYAVFKVLKWISDNVGKVAASANGIIGGGSGAQFPVDTMGNPTGAAMDLPQPAMATTGGATGSWTDNSKTEIKIVQQPGQNTRALADEVGRELERRKAIAQRGNLYDRANQ